VPAVTTSPSSNCCSLHLFLPRHSLCSAWLSHTLRLGIRTPKTKIDCSWLWLEELEGKQSALTQRSGYQQLGSVQLGVWTGQSGGDTSGSVRAIEGGGRELRGAVGFALPLPLFLSFFAKWSGSRELRPLQQRLEYAQRVTNTLILLREQGRNRALVLEESLRIAVVLCERGALRGHEPIYLRSFAFAEGSLGRRGNNFRFSRRFARFLVPGISIAESAACHLPVYHQSA
jgi:hypothetical protein